MLKSSVMPECPAGLLIRVQPNTYIEKTEHFQTALHLVKVRGQLNKGYNTQEVWEIQPRQLCWHLLCCLWVMQQTTLAGLSFNLVCHQGTCEV
jgi:hypothetical protein